MGSRFDSARIVSRLSIDKFKKELLTLGISAKQKVINLNNTALINSTTLSTNDTGALITIDPSTDESRAITITMPTPTPGVNFDLLIKKDQINSGADIILKTHDSATDFEGAIICNDGAADIAAITSSTSKITIDATNVKTVAGTTVRITCDGTDWYIVIVHPQDGKDCVAAAAASGVQYVLEATV